MTDLEAVHAAILAEPDDDLHRLAYADLLEERGGPGDDARAEFVRNAIRQPHASFVALTREEDPFPLLGLATPPEVYSQGDVHRWCWAETDDIGCAIIEYGSCIAYHENRGFIERVRCSTADWHTHGPRLVREHPICVVRLMDKEPRLSITYGWAWQPLVEINGLGLRLPHLLPSWLWSHLVGRYLGAVRCETRAEADAALSDACLSWAKSTPLARPTRTANRRSAAALHISAENSPGTSRPDRW